METRLEKRVDSFETFVGTDSPPVEKPDGPEKCTPIKAATTTGSLHKGHSPWGSDPGETQVLKATPTHLSRMSPEAAIQQIVLTENPKSLSSTAGVHKCGTSTLQAVRQKVHVVSTLHNLSRV
jgi:hypothetical protein